MPLFVFHFDKLYLRLSIENYQPQFAVLTKIFLFDVEANDFMAMPPSDLRTF